MLATVQIIVKVTDLTEADDYAAFASQELAEDNLGGAIEVHKTTAEELSKYNDKYLSSLGITKEHLC